MFNYKCPYYLLAISVIVLFISSLETYSGGKEQEKSSSITQQEIKKPLLESEPDSQQQTCEPIHLDDCQGEQAICDNNLKPFLQDCNFQCRYRSINEHFKELKINPEFLVKARALRLMPDKAFQKSKKKDVFEPWDVYSPNPDTWVHWEKGNFYRERLNETLQKRKELDPNTKWKLDLSDLKSLHSKYLNKSLVSSVPFLYVFDAFKKKFPLPGELRDQGSAQSGFTAEVTADEKRQLEMISQLPSQDGSPYLETKFKKQRNGTFTATVTYMESARVEASLQSLINKINDGVNGFLNGTKKDESPLEFAARVQKTYVAIHPFHEGNGRMSRFLQDLIFSALGLPLIPAGQLQEDITPTFDRYVRNTKEEIQSSLDYAEKCLQEHHQAACSSSYKLSPECKLLYPVGSGQKIKETVMKTLAADVPSCQMNANNVLDAQSDLNEHLKRISQWGVEGSGNSATIPLSNETKRAIIEAVATPLKEDLKTFSWVSSDAAAFSRKNIYTNSFLFKNAIVGESAKTGKLTRAGNGLYVSKNPFSSVEYSFADDKCSMFENDRDKRDECRAKIREQNRASTGENRLFVVTIKKGKKYIDVTDENTLSILDKFGIGTEDVYEQNPNVVVYYNNESKWMNIKLTDPSAFAVRPAAHHSDFSLVDAIQSEAFLSKVDFKGQIGDRHILRTFFDSKKRAVENEIEHWAQSPENIGKTICNPFTQKCLKLVDIGSFERVKRLRGEVVYFSGNERHLLNVEPDHEGTVITFTYPTYSVMKVLSENGDIVAADFALARCQINEVECNGANECSWKIVRNVGVGIASKDALDSIIKAHCDR